MSSPLTTVRVDQSADRYMYRCLEHQKGVGAAWRAERGGGGVFTKGARHCAGPNPLKQSVDIARHLQGCLCL